VALGEDITSCLLIHTYARLFYCTLQHKEPAGGIVVLFTLHRHLGGQCLQNSQPVCGGAADGDGLSLSSPELCSSEGVVNF